MDEEVQLLFWAITTLGGGLIAGFIAYVRERFRHIERQFEREDHVHERIEKKLEHIGERLE